MRLAHVVAAAALIVSLAAGGGLAAGESETLSIGDARTPERAFGTRLLGFRVRLSQPSQEPVSVSYRTQNEIARADEDYASTQGTLQFASGETTMNIWVSIRGDRKVEPDEFFSVLLYAPVNATVAEPGGVGTGTIQNDDFAAPLPRKTCMCARVKLRLAGFNWRGAMPLTAVVKATMTCAAGDVADCAGFVKAVSPPAPLKPFTCRAKRCSSTNTYTLRVRVALQPLQKQLRLRAGCRGEHGVLRTFTLPSK
jgi:Calx-beta domain-containing protein